MKIDLSKQEYADLLLMAAIGERVICNDTLLNEYDKRQKSVSKTLNALCEYAKDFGMEDAIEIWQGKTHLSEHYIFGVFDIMQEYEEEYVFWETGAVLLARRDFSETYSEAEWNAMDDEEARRIFFDMRMKYLSEWEEYGYDRLRIVEGRVDKSLL